MWKLLENVLENLCECICWIIAVAYRENSCSRIQYVALRCWWKLFRKSKKYKGNLLVRRKIRTERTGDGEHQYFRQINFSNNHYAISIVLSNEVTECDFKKGKSFPPKRWIFPPKKQKRVVGNFAILKWWVSDKINIYMFLCNISINIFIETINKRIYSTITNNFPPADIWHISN